MLRWFVFTVVFGLLPFGFSVLMQALHGPGARLGQNSPELLFFAVMVSASQLGEIFGTLARPDGLPWRRKALRTPLTLAFALFLVGAILSAALYGVYVNHERDAFAARLCGGEALASLSAEPACHEWLDFQTNLFRFSVRLAAVLGIASGISVWMQTRRTR